MCAPTRNIFEMLCSCVDDSVGVLFCIRFYRTHRKFGRYRKCVCVCFGRISLQLRLQNTWWYGTKLCQYGILRHQHMKFIDLEAAHLIRFQFVCVCFRIRTYFLIWLSHANIFAHCALNEKEKNIAESKKFKSKKNNKQTNKECNMASIWLD